MTPKRLENAIDKLAKAFINDELNAYDCAQCAVGNICNNEDQWSLAIQTGTIKEYLNIKCIRESNYSITELAEVEHIFLEAVGAFAEGESNLDYGIDEKFTRDCNYRGLIAVVDLLFSFEDLDNQKIKQEQLNKFEYEQEHN